MMKPEEISLRRSSSSCRSTRRILPSNYIRSTSSLLPDRGDVPEKHLLRNNSAFSLQRLNKARNMVAIIRSLLGVISLSTLIPTCRWLSLPSRLSSSPSLGRKVTGTLFGHKKGHVSFAVQEDPRSEPVLLLELPTSTCSLVKEMSSGLVRIALECEKGSAGGGRSGKLFQEPVWAMYCNGRKCGYSVSRTCGDSDWQVLSTVQTVSVGAGVIPEEKCESNNAAEGELMYMRARFERVVGSRDSEAFYMMNPDGNGGPELSIFLLRI
ncbi:PREDICTED: protein MIZU-KUSSEI 1-like [Nelumbo nucifera]|uniref:Protein MIZU-KUSSEI 1-like n=1 Tax=Nelumbo nucifera TaxID=4432 RepID=A0A1U8B2B0_NELNU|nr:PREDICTED: protein MIZU-KUSSEI 1-like [Nelumbo nucifera]